VRADTSETALKRIVWQVLNRPKEHYLYIRNARNEDEERYTISRQWTYILLAQPKQRQPEKSASSGAFVNGKLRTTWNLFERYVNANTAWSEQKAMGRMNE
jgi:hypothetical protein